MRFPKWEGGGPGPADYKASAVRFKTHLLQVDPELLSKCPAKNRQFIEYDIRILIDYMIYIQYILYLLIFI